MTENDQNETQNYELQFRFLIINVSLLRTWFKTWTGTPRTDPEHNFKNSWYDVFALIHDNVIFPQKLSKIFWKPKMSSFFRHNHASSIYCVPDIKISRDQPTHSHSRALFIYYSRLNWYFRVKIEFWIKSWKVKCPIFIPKSIYIFQRFYCNVKKIKNLQIFANFGKLLFHLRLIFMNEFNREYSESLNPIASQLFLNI